MSEYEPGALPHNYWAVDGQGTALVQGGVIDESLVSIYVNGQELATVMCSPLDQEALAVGFLYTEGVVERMDEIALVRANLPRTVVDILLQRAEFTLPRRMILTSGCGRGVTFQRLANGSPPLQTPFATTPDIVLQRMRDLHGEARLYNLVRGVHTAVLANRERVLVSAEDVGRHNALDKIAGKALMSGIDPRDSMLLTSGRISSEMLSKARRMGVPLVASRTAPTSTAVQLAHAWNICVAGYVRSGGLRVYTHPHRLGLDPLPASASLSVHTAPGSDGSHA